MTTIKKYGATWCGACKELDEKLKGVLEYESVDVDEESEAIAEFDLKKLPTLIIFNEFGDETKRFVGASVELEDITPWLNQE